MPTDPSSKRWRCLAWLPLLLVGWFGSEATFATSATAEEKAVQDSTIVHLRVHAGEPYIQRAAEVDRKSLVFNSVWVTRKYFPSAEDTNNGDPAWQAFEVAQGIQFVREKLGMRASPGFGLHPILWLNRESWQLRADALEVFITAGGFEGMEISLDIEGYGYVDANKKRIRTPPPQDARSWIELLAATEPVREVLRKYNIRATFYPAGNRKFGPYTRAALALGASRFGDEYTFVLAGKMKDGETLTKEQWQVWRERLTNTDPGDLGIHYIPGFFTSNFPNGSLDRVILNWMGVKECWLFVDDKGFLQ